MDWVLDGDGEFVFQQALLLDAEQTLVLVSFDPNDPEMTDRVDAFKAHYSVEDIQLTGGFSGTLQIDFGSLSLFEVGNSPVEDPEFIPHFLIDAIEYDGNSPWPVLAQGSSLSRISVSSYGNDPQSWQATENPTPGSTPLKPEPELLLPDLVPWIDSRIGFNQFEYLDHHAANDHLLMRFATASANIGAGPMIIQGREPTANGQRVVQLIQTDEGGVVERDAGEFIYHPTHNHIHFDDYASYLLREIDEDGGMGDVVASGGKVSFCLVDFAPYDLDFPGAPPSFVYTLCDGGTQGISVGWADIYAADLDDQWIDIENVPPGEYWFETIIDPSNLLQESDETNNSFATKVILGVPEYAPDFLDAEEINSFAVGVGDKLLTDLSIHRPGDVDTFRWTAGADGIASVEVAFDYELGDIDLYVWGSNGLNEPFLIESLTETNSETAEFEVVSGRTYVIVVRDYAGHTNPNYTLEIDGPELDRRRIRTEQ